MFVMVGFNMVPFQRMGRDSQHQGGGHGSMLRTWVTDLARGFVMHCRALELTRGSEMRVLRTRLSNVLL